jgi:signal transduction histidine kinase
MGEPAGVDGSFWRAITVFRVGSLGYAVLVFAGAEGYYRPVEGWLVIAVMALWTAIAAFAYSRSPGWPLLVVDLLVTLGCLVSSPFVYGPAGGSMPITATWVATPVLAWAVFGGRRAGVVAAAVTAATDFALRGMTAATINSAVLLLLAALTVGHVTRLARQAEERLQLAARQEAAGRERERLARGIHDSVLQVLALVQRRGLEIGGEAAELGRLAGEQERALRELVRGEPATAAGAGAGLADLGALLRRYSAADVTVSTATSQVLMPADRALEVAAAVGAALDNTRRHAGDGAKAWILVEAAGDVVTVTVRDDGAGMPDGRLPRAAAEGRIGVAKSIVGRVTDLGGTVGIVSAPGQGVEIELSIPVDPASHPSRLGSRP